MATKPKESVQDVCRLTLTIRGVDYRVTPIRTPSDQTTRSICNPITDHAPRSVTPSRTPTDPTTRAWKLNRLDGKGECIIVTERLSGKWVRP
jgi:hypothetical protein